MHGKDLAVAAALATVLEAQEPMLLQDEREHSHVSAAPQVELHEELEVPSPIHCVTRHDGLVKCLEIAHNLLLHIEGEDEVDR